MFWLDAAHALVHLSPRVDEDLEVATACGFRWRVDP
jgi:hypothetical protein